MGLKQGKNECLKEGAVSPSVYFFHMSYTGVVSTRVRRESTSFRNAMLRDRRRNIQNRGVRSIGESC